MNLAQGKSSGVIMLSYFGEKNSFYPHGHIFKG